MTPKMRAPSAVAWELGQSIGFFDSLDMRPSCSTLVCSEVLGVAPSDLERVLSEKTFDTPGVERLPVACLPLGGQKDMPPPGKPLVRIGPGQLPATVKIPLRRSRVCS